jgi:hypothetical protein
VEPDARPEGVDMSYRDEALARLDVLAFFAAQGVELRPLSAKERRFACPFHDDREPSANVNIETGLWHCHSENIGGGPIDFLMHKGMKAREAIDAIGAMSGMPPSTYTNGHTNGHTNGAAKPARPSKLTEANATKWHEAALRNTNILRWLHEKRGYSDDTLVTFQLGWDGARVTLPIRDDAGELVNIRRRRDPSDADDSPAGKVLGLPGANDARLWPLPLPDGDVLLLEGEWDVMLARQMGFDNAVTVTSGAGIFRPEWASDFADKTVTICYDNDDTGRRGSQRVASMLAPFANVRILQIPGLPEKGDITDFFVEQGRSPDELRDLISDATPYVLTIATASEPTEARRTTLAEASDARLHGQRLAVPVLLSGKAMTPFKVPYKARVHCDMSNKRFCPICPLHDVHGNREVTLTAMDPAVLSLVNVTNDQSYKAMKQLAGAVTQCNRPQVEVSEYINIEELRVIPELDAAITAGETEYVARQAFLLGHGTMPNRGYEMRGYTHAHPKSQAAVHLFSEAIPSQDNISAFAMTPELRDSLKVFHAAPGELEARWRSIYNDFAANVHRIQDRFDMQIAYDLAWHSVIAFTFNGAYVRRGWVEAMVMGDSGQGKTEMAMALLGHYRLGERVQGEQTSTAGLIGGLEKMGDTWLLSWGRVPLNDKRLLIIDETQGLPSAQIEGMSDVRATGVAEITKIRTERTNARCRIVWLANPSTGQTLAQHDQGVKAIAELFKKPEDVRRLDFAIAVASGDIDFARAINIRHAAAAMPAFDTDRSRSLVLWAWSRRPDQVVFASEATDEILVAATEMGRRYHASIPLVEPSDQRLKLARLAAAAAARVYSTDETGELVVVQREHVRFIVAYLERIYSSSAMAYDEYSLQHRSGETLTASAMSNVESKIRGWENADDAIAFFRRTSIFKRTDLEDALGWSTDEVKVQLRFLSAYRLIEQRRLGYVKTAAFITLLRTLDGAPIPLDEAAF